MSEGDAELVLATRHGQAIRFEEGEVRPMGRTARGVKGVDLEEGDEVVSALAPRRDAELLAAGAHGFGKRVPFTELRLQGRAGKGAAVLPGRDQAGDLVALLEVHPRGRVVWRLASGELRDTPVEEIPSRSRSDAALRIIGNLGGAPVADVHPLHGGGRGDRGEDEEAERPGPAGEPRTGETDASALAPGEAPEGHGDGDADDGVQGELELAGE